MALAYGIRELAAAIGLPELVAESGAPTTGPVELAVDSATRLYPLGYTVFDDAGNAFRYVHNRRVSCEAGDVVAFDDNNIRWNVTEDESNSIANAVAGVVVGGIGTNDYGWIQVAGVAEAVNKTGAAISEGQMLIASDTTDGQVQPLGESEFLNPPEIRRMVGYALHAATGGAGQVLGVHLRGLF